MLFFVSLAHAGLPWDCPDIVTPADAAAFRDTEGGGEAAYDRLYEAALTYWDDDCAWVETVTESWDESTYELACTTADATVVSTRIEALYDDGSSTGIVTAWRLEVEVPAGETWTRITLASTEGGASSGSWTSSDSGSYSASWEGAFEDFPSDGWIVSAWGSSDSRHYRSKGRLVETPTCTLDWDVRTYTDDSYMEDVRSNDTWVWVYGYSSGICPLWFANATVDDVQYGAVSMTTWEDDPADVDRDGVPAPCDCDEADPTVNPMTEDLVNDGIDQNCDGVDAIDMDLDLDGHHDAAVGGTDCDDADAGVYPGALDLPGDGVDQDCDGADDIDADGDGYTADGDDRSADCDDTDATVHPYAVELDCDGVDQDCDGLDPCGPDTGATDSGEMDDTAATDDTADTASSSEEEPPDASAGSETSTGCGGAAAWLPLLLLGGRRRGRSPEGGTPRGRSDAGVAI